MNEPDGWSTPQGWGAPTPPAAGPHGTPASPSWPSPSSPSGPPPSLTPGAGAPGSSWPGQAPSWQGSPGADGASWQGGPGQGGPGQGVPPWGYRPADLKPGVVPLRPLGLGEVLDGAVGVLRRYPRPALGLAALVAVVTTLFDVVLLVTAFQPFLTVDSAALERGDVAALEDALGGAFAGGALGVLLALLSGAVLTGAITTVVGKAVLGEPLTFGQAWALVRPRLLGLVGLSLVTLVAVYGVVVLAVAAAVALVAAGGAAAAFAAVPLVLASLAVAVWLYVRLALAPCALVLERIGVRASLRRSGVLVRRDWWRVFGILLLTLVITLFVSQVIELPLTVLGAGSPGNLLAGGDELLSTRSLVLSSIGGAIAATLIAPFTAAVRALLYVDRRMRAEGLDVSLAAAATSRP